MNLISTLKMTALSTALLLVGCSSSTMTTSSTKSIPSVSSNAVYSKPRTLDNFNDYVQFLKGKAAAEGVSLSVLNAQNNIQYMQKAVDLDRAQAGRSQRNADQPQLPNPNGTTNYLNKVLTQNKWILPKSVIGKSKHHYNKQANAMVFNKNISLLYGVWKVALAIIKVAMMYYQL